MCESILCFGPHPKSASFETFVAKESLFVLMSYPIPDRAFYQALTDI